MGTAEPVSEAVRRAVERVFAPADVAHTLAALGTVRSPRVREAIVVVTYGDRAFLDKLVGWADDSRDVYKYFEPRHLEFGAGGHDGVPRDEALRRMRELGLMTWWDSRTQADRDADAVRRFVAERLIVPPERIQDSTRLQADLGLAGPAGLSFIRAFAERFRVSLDAFHPERHFHRRDWEGLPRELARRLLRRPRKALEPITVGDLIAMVRAKRRGEGFKD